MPRNHSTLSGRDVFVKPVLRYASGMASLPVLEPSRKIRRSGAAKWAGRGVDRRPCADRRPHRPLAQHRSHCHAGRTVGGDGLRQIRHGQCWPDLLCRRDPDHRDLRPLLLRLGLPSGGVAGSLPLVAREDRHSAGAFALAPAACGTAYRLRLHVPVAGGLPLVGSAIRSPTSRPNSLPRNSGRPSRVG